MAKVVKQCVGIDISKDDFKVCFKVLFEKGEIKIKGSSSFDNNPTGFSKFVRWVEKRIVSDSVLNIVMEATGVYYENLCYYLYEQNYEVSVELATKVKYYIKSKNIKLKNDKVDASAIAELGLERILRKWAPVCSEIRTLRFICRELHSLKKERTRVGNQLHALHFSYQAADFVVNLKEKQKSQIGEMIEELEKELITKAKLDKVLWQKIEKISTVKGLGVISILTVVCETGGFKLFDNIRQLVSYAGLDVVENQSGKFTGKGRISKKGNSHIRATLYMPAISAGNHNENLRAYYLRMQESQGDAKRRSLVAVMRKLLILIYTLWKNDMEYDPNYEKNKNLIKK